jgi:hypothetical protein
METEVERLESTLGVECESMEGVGSPKDYTCMSGGQAVILDYDDVSGTVGSVGMLVPGLDPEFLTEVAGIYGFSAEEVANAVMNSDVAEADGLQFFVQGGLQILIRKTD